MELTRVYVELKTELVGGWPVIFTRHGGIQTQIYLVVGRTEDLSPGPRPTSVDKKRLRNN